MTQIERICVVGSGLAGLASATLLSDQGHDVTLIESMPVLGGLLRGRLQPGLGNFDCGTHLIEETGNERLDGLLFQHMDEASGWNHFTQLPNATFFGGRLSSSGFIDSRCLPADLYSRGLEEMLALTPAQPEGNLQRALEARFGGTFARHIHAPAVRKLLGCSLDQLAAPAILPFGLNRLLCGTSAMSDSLKRQDAWHDARLAFHEPRPGLSGKRYFYPASGGVARWVEKVAAELTAAGVQIMTGDAVASLSMRDRMIDSFTLVSGKHVPMDRLVWSAPPIGLMKLSKQALPTGIARPLFTQTLLFDLIVDQAPIVDALYVSCYDPAYDTFRVTLYDNLERSRHEAPHRVTIEVVRPPDVDAEAPEVSSLFDEIRRMGILATDAQLVQSAADLMPVSYPLVTEQFLEDQNRIIESANTIARNILLVGQGSGAGFFKADIVRHIIGALAPDDLSQAA